MSLTFTDISSAQGNINLSEIKTDGLIVKLTGGKSYKNPYAFKANDWFNMNKPTGVYHYINNDGGTPQQQADHFLEVAGSLVGKVPLLIDYESNANKVYNATLLGTAWLKTLLDYIYEKTKVRCFVYTNYNIMSHQNFSAIANSGYPLWLADYQENIPQPKYWSTIAMWQNTSTPLDHSFFYGDLNTWNKYATADGESSIKVNSAPSNVQPQSFKDSLGVTWFRQNGIYTLQQATYLRWGATTHSTKIALLSVGQTVNYDAYCYSGGYVWIRQPRGNNFGYLATGKASGNKRLNYWGKFK